MILEMNEENEKLVTTPKPFVFVLMPFESKFDDVYKLGIKAACTDSGAYCERVDEQYYEGTMLERIYNQISRADFIIADMTGRNPNVFYEVGYAHALNKRVILVTTNADDIPFDLKNYPHIPYKGSITTLKEELFKRVTWAIENPIQVEQYLSQNLECHVNGVNLSSKAPIIVNVAIGEAEIKELKFEVDFHSSTRRFIQHVKFQAGIIASKPTSRITALQDTGTWEFRSYPLPETDQTLFILYDDFDILPGSWSKTIFTSRCSYGGKGWRVDKKYEFTIRIFMDSGPIDFPFTVKIEESRLD